MAEQNILLCLFFSALGALFAVIADVCLIIPHDEKKRGIVVPKWKKHLAAPMNIFFQTASFVFYTFAPIIGPVSLYRPTAMSAKLFSNFLIIGVIMRRERFGKDAQVATCSISLAAIVLPVVGPRAQDNQDIYALILEPAALTWGAILLIIFVLSSAVMFWTDLSKRRQMFTHACLLGVSISASVIGPTIARAFSMSQGWVRIVLITFYVFTQLCWLFENYIEATAVLSRIKFVPIFFSGSLFMNAVTGVIIWEDWRVVNSWVGYVCSSDDSRCVSDE